MKILCKLLRLKNPDLQLLLITGMTLAIIRLGLWLLPWRNMYKLLNKTAPISLDIPEADETAWRRVVWAVEAVSRYMLPKPKCLARALVTQIILAWQGYRTQLRIGVAKNQQGNLEAHAWIESRGQIIIGKLINLSKYKPLSPLEQKSVKAA